VVALESLYQTGEKAALISFVEDALAFAGGRLHAGYSTK
jgi:hypothetical protein